jgi:leucyl-tRNA synthetase
MVHGETHKSQVSGKYLKKDEVIYESGKPREKSTGFPVETVFEKMSKSKYNGVDPQSVIEQHGADNTRLFILFKGNFYIINF